MIKEARRMLILSFKICRLWLKGKQYAGKEFYNRAIHEEELLVTFVS